MLFDTYGRVLSALAGALQLRELINRIRDGLARGAYPNERAVSTSIVVPLLRALGWDDSDPDQVIPEYNSGRGRVDYALRCPPRSPLAFIEVKGVGRSSEADRQLFEYAFHEGVPLAILTDGREWNFYLPAQQGSYSDRRVYQLVIDERETDESVERLIRYLNRRRLADGLAIASATSDYQDARSRREARDTMPVAWNELLREPDGLLLDLLLEKTEALSGFRPDPIEAESFLKNASEAIASNLIPPPQRSPAKSTDQKRPAAVHSVTRSIPDVSPVGPQYSWRVAGEAGKCRNGIEAYLAFLESAFRQFPNERETIVAAARTRSRNNIAVRPEDIYPDRPDLGQKSSRKIISGFYVGTNLSNSEKRKLAEQISRAIGLTFGTSSELNI